MQEHRIYQAAGILWDAWSACRRIAALPDDCRPATLDDGLYYPDGQIQDEVYVWGSFVQSRMHAAGVRCSDCHDPHRLRLRADGDAVCLQCHRETPVERFPTLRSGRYAAPDHHFHPPDSAGARCVACHMPARTYMQVDPRRDHGFRIPRPDLSVSLGTPNARRPLWGGFMGSNFT